MRCEEVMKKDVQCASPTDTVQAAARRMRDENIGFLPVCDTGNKILGIVTDRDLACRILAEGKSGQTAVSDVMSKEIVTCRPGDDLRKAEELLGQEHKSRIVVIDQGGRLAGVISLSDIAQREDDEHVARTMRQITGREARIH